MKDDRNPGLRATKDSGYADRLERIQRSWWKTFLDVQAPYRWNIRRLKPGFTLDVGCGIGRNLIHLNNAGVGIDHNVQAVSRARARGLNAFTPDEFDNSIYNLSERFDSILLAHVAEHMTEPETVELLNKYLPMLKAGGKVIIITPQEAGYKSDRTHIQFFDFYGLREILKKVGLTFVREYSFPFPRFAGNLFTYNEFISIAVKTSNFRPLAISNP